MIRGQYMNIDQDNNAFTDQEFRYRVNSKLDTITFIVTAEENLLDTLHIDLHPRFNQLLADYGKVNVTNIPPEKMMVRAENQNLRIKIYFRFIKLHREENLVKPMEYSADILYKIKSK